MNSVPKWTVRVGLVLAAGTLCAATLVGCTAAATPKPNYRAWTDRMVALLVTPSKGQGGAGGVIQHDGNAKTATSEVELSGVAVGKYDVLAVCTGSGIVRFSVSKGGSAHHVLAYADIACGATLRLPVTITSSDIVLEAKDDNTTSAWEAAIVPSGWEPSRTIYG
jgi:phage tail sheath gpL-like